VTPGKGTSTAPVYRRGAVIVALAALTACGPVSLESAERQCFESARLAAKPRGEVALGVTSDRGAVGRIELDLSTDYIMGRDPAVVYETCVMSKAGQPPSRPLYARPDWKG
jgi:hypothetical protein